MEGGPYQEYFYIEIPVTAGSSVPSTTGTATATATDSSSADGGSDAESSSSSAMVSHLSSSNSVSSRVEKGKHRRFVYVQEESAKKFPMQFGLEVRLCLLLCFGLLVLVCLVSFSNARRCV